jgi:membrane protease YdiL (CAAX protease family)
MVGEPPAGQGGEPREPGKPGEPRRGGEPGKPAEPRRGGEPGEPGEPAEPRRGGELRDVFVAFALACAGVAALAAVGRAVPLIDRNLGALVAVVFLYLPFFFAGRRGEDLVAYGFHAGPVGRGLAIGAGAPLVLFPLFAAVFVLFYDVACRPGQAEWLRMLTPPGSCPGWDGWGGVHAPHIGLDFLELVFVQIVVIALPEELFFRGFLHELCERALPPRRRLLGGGVGRALLLSSALFALGHLAAGFDLRRLSVFFPGLLFGWMRSATGSILAGVICHAASNLFIRLLEQMFF